MMNRLHKYMNFLGVSIALMATVSTASFAASAAPAAPSETHAFEVTLKAKYRCFGGNPSTKSDPRTGVKCDNQEKTTVFLNKEVVNIQIQQEPSPEKTNTLVGDFVRDYKFQGRVFTVNMSLYKELPPNAKANYMMLLVANMDNGARQGFKESAF